jgi:hypothetical protein
VGLQARLAGIAGTAVRAFDSDANWHRSKGLKLGGGARRQTQPHDG